MKRIIPSLVILIFVFLQKPIYPEIKYKGFRNTNLLISGWRPEYNSDKERKAGFKTIDALKKFKKVRRLKPYFKEAKGYAVFPNVGKAGFGIGGARGKGEVFEDDKVIGSTTLTQLSFGFQLGGQAFSQIIFFQDE